jgi:phosphatidylinositol alpha-1,6-mannosyltransferase
MRKGQKQIIALWPRILRTFPDAEYWIVGGGEGRGELEQIAQQHGVTHAVKFTGDIPDAELSDLYRASAVYAMPSWGEGFGLVFADAMAHGLPCIANRYDAGCEVVADGVTGWHVDPEDPEEIFQALCRLLGDASLRAQMGAAGRERVAELFSLSGFEERAVRLLVGAAGT